MAFFVKPRGVAAQKTTLSHVYILFIGHNSHILPTQYSWAYKERGEMLVPPLTVWWLLKALSGTSSSGRALLENEWKLNISSKYFHVDVWEMYKLHFSYWGAHNSTRSWWPHIQTETWRHHQCLPSLHWCTCCSTCHRLEKDSWKLTLFFKKNKKNWADNINHWLQYLVGRGQVFKLPSKNTFGQLDGLLGKLEYYLWIL